MKLLTYKTAAEILDCSASKVQKLCLAGEIPIFKVGNETRIILEDLERWIKNGRHYHEKENSREDNRRRAIPTKEATIVQSK